MTRLLSFSTGWPWLGLGAAVLLLLVLLFGTRQSPHRTLEPNAARHAVLGLALYMLHQFEEHGIDLRGEAYAFLGHLCAGFGFSDASACPVPVSFISAVNLGTVWLAFAISILVGPRRPVLALSAWAIPLVNAPIHIVTALREAAYNPGLLTGIAVLLPAAIWVFRVHLKAGNIDFRDLRLIALAGVAAHAVLMGSLMGFLRDLYGEGVLAAIQVANAGIPFLIVLIGSRKRIRTGSAPSPAA